MWEGKFCQGQKDWAGLKLSRVRVEKWEISIKTGLILSCGLGKPQNYHQLQA